MFFGGKGGVGKTTCAAAWALAAAAGPPAGRAKAGWRVLIVSTDPAHSLGDALGVRLSSRVTAVRAGARTIWAMELDGPRAYARWLGEHRRALGDAIEHGTWLDREDIEALLQLSVPGIDELVGLLEIVRVAGRSPRFDLVVVDTAPTGHTLRLLSAPAAVAAVAGTLDALQREHRMIRERLARIGRPEAADRLVALLADQARQIGALLRDPARAEFHWLTLPEEMSIAESEDALRELRRSRIRVAGVIVNRVLPDGDPCPTCDPRRAGEREAIASIAGRLPGRPAVRLVFAEPKEPRGVAALTRIGQRLRRETEKGVGSRLQNLPTVKNQPGSPLFSSSVAGKGVGTRFPGRLLFFGGKGGVGKTTAAAAAALQLARADPRRGILLLSTDPAHSLGDVFGIAVGDRPRSIPGAPKNLRVRELDAPAALATRRGDLEAALNDVAGAMGSDALTGSGGVSQILELAPPGIDELLGILEVAEQIREQPGTTIVVDTAPTGHALRLLEMPDTAREWVQVVLGVLLKYRQLVRPGQLAAELVALSRSIRGLQELLHDRAATHFIVVTRAAAVPRLETQRLFARLRRLKLPASAIVVNALTLAPGRCRWCLAVASAERRELAILTRTVRRQSRECAIILTPLTAPPPRGVAALNGWATTWALTSTV